MEASTDISLKALVDYAISIDDEAKAEHTELMCYRLLGDRITPEDAREIARIHQHYKALKEEPKVSNVYNIGGNYNGKVEEQNNRFMMPTSNKQQKMIEE
jgi:hypothetical protein